MDDYLSTLIGRSWNRVETIQPRPVSLFEPPVAGMPVGLSYSNPDTSDEMSLVYEPVWEVPNNTPETRRVQPPIAPNNYFQSPFGQLDLEPVGSPTTTQQLLIRSDPLQRLETDLRQPEQFVSPSSRLPITSAPPLSYQSLPFEQETHPTLAYPVVTEKSRGPESVPVQPDGHRAPVPPVEQSPDQVAQPTAVLPTKVEEPMAAMPLPALTSPYTQSLEAQETGVIPEERDANGRSEHKTVPEVITTQMVIRASVPQPGTEQSNTGIITPPLIQATQPMAVLHTQIEEPVSAMPSPVFGRSFSQSAATKEMIIVPEQKDDNGRSEHDVIPEFVVEQTVLSAKTLPIQPGGSRLQQGNVVQPLIQIVKSTLQTDNLPSATLSPILDGTEIKQTNVLSRERAGNGRSEHEIMPGTAAESTGTQTNLSPPAQPEIPRPQNRTVTQSLVQVAKPTAVSSSQALEPIPPAKPVSPVQPQIKPIVKQMALATPDSKMPEPVPNIQITIGRIEVRAIPALAAAPRKGRSQHTGVTLTEYLRQRNGGIG